MAATAFPLSWPEGWPRPRTPASQRRPAKFRSGGGMNHAKGYRDAGKPVTIAAAVDRLEGELELLGAAGVILSTNVEPKLNGLPRSGQPEPADPGAAVYFTWKQRPMALACDRWTTVGGNIAALAAHIEALRGIERWGVGSLEQAFTGYLKLAAPSSDEDWRTVLKHPRSLDEAERTFKALALTAHPDRGGSDAAMARLTAAIAAARKEMSR